jgi:8-oxo-dGTP pyrophosphatase MutT (NUDIX family)
MMPAGKTSGKGDEQYAALPWRRGASGEVEVLVITSRETQRWVLPKGWPMRDRTPWAAAAQEAFEEAGVTGDIRPDPIGAYSYDKRLRDGTLRPVRVTVFALEVLVEQTAWPERDQREKLWTTAQDAAARVDEPELKTMLEALAP